MREEKRVVIHLGSNGAVEKKEDIGGYMASRDRTIQ